MSLHLTEDEGVLLDVTSENLYRLNTTAAFIWCCVEDGASPTDAAARVRQTFGTTDDDARSYVTAAIDGWVALGLLTRAGEDVPAAAQPRQRQARRARAAAPFSAIAERNYRLLDTHFRLRFAASATAAEVHRFLVPLAERMPTSRDRITIDVHEDGDRLALVHDGHIIERWAAREEIVPVAKIALVTLALERSRDFGALHAGAVCRAPDAPCVIIAGVSGAGKSTLVAGLATGGFTSLGDDTVVLARDTLAVRAVPFGICLKDGAWNVLSARIPGLAEQPVHRRLDGKRVRYFVPPGATPPDRIRCSPAVAVVFPNRAAGGRGELVRISHADALTRLASEFCPLGGRMDAETVDRLIQWVGAMACYELRCSTLEEGITAIGGLCP